ncbi:MAG TPA: zinc-ribbon domain-containing protein [Ktedonobacteraceae bacterium]|nr:zinc-ribbon domain-containing protein [Ktedonobacteraceae bacterium]
MSQFPRACPSCGSPVPAGQRFCSNCGTDLLSGPAGPSSQYGGQAPQSQQPYAQPQYGQQPYGQYGQPPIQSYQQPQKSNPFAEALGALGLLFFLRRYRPGYRPRRQSSGCCGCLVALIILGLLFGAPAYFYVKQNPKFVQQFQNQIQNSSSNNGSVPTTQPAVTTTKTGQTVNYVGVDITVVDVKQSTAFIDDNNTATNGMIRLDIKESTGQNVGFYSYGDAFRLILPDGTSVSPVGEETSGSPQTATSRNNWVDFQVSTSIKPDQVQLLLGTPQEAQIKFLLTGKVDPQFLPKTATLNIPISYGGVNWTLKTATSSLSSGGKQASTGMHYVVLTFILDNPTSQTSNTSFTGDYMRLQSGSAKNRPTDSTLPDATANTSALSGTVTFLMPNNGNAFTLILLAIPGGIDPHSNVQVNTDFKI